MGKKKGRGKTSTADSFEDILGPRCKHIRKGVDQGQLKKTLIEFPWSICQDCKPDVNIKQHSEEETDESPTIWLCLKCGHRGCGRNSEETHALKHYETPRSEPHCLVLGLDNWSVWCYICDEEIQYSSTGLLGQVLDYIRNLASKDGPNHYKKQQVNELENGDNTKTEKEIQNAKELENKKTAASKAEKENTPVKSSTTASKAEEENTPVKSSTTASKAEKENTPVKSSTTASKAEKENTAIKSSIEVTVKGLSNLGNTCFFNSVMQNLSQTPVLRELLKEVQMTEAAVKIAQLDSSLPQPLVVKLEHPGPLTSAMYQFLMEMQETKKGVVIPKELFSQVCKKAVRFRGFRQQDSQELLRYLLDGMRTEEIMRISAGMLKILSNSTENLDEEVVKKKIKEYEKKGAIASFVDRIFGGELSSTIMCEECKTVSLVTESFLDLSLPVLDDQRAKKKNGEKYSAMITDNNEQDEDDWNYVKERNDTSSGVSKHQEKKVKKQAKKQAKNQRRQQKLKGKVISLGDVSTVQEELDEICDSNEEIPSQGDSGHSNAINCPQQDEKESVEIAPSELDCVNHSNSASNQENSLIGGDRDESSETPVAGEYADEDVSDAIDSTSDSINRFQSLCLETSIEDKEDISDSLDTLTLNDDVLSLGDIELDVEDNSSSLETKGYQVVSEDPETAFCTLADRGSVNTEQSSIQTCLFKFILTERLTGANQLQCNVCSQRQQKAKKNCTKGEMKLVYTNAQKQMLISLPPAILTLHLKRFQQTGHNLLKVNKHVQFPLVLDLSPFCSLKCKNVAEEDKRVLYSLYGIVEHSGSMKSGHYTAYVKVRTPNSSLTDHVLNGTVPKAVTEAEPQSGHWFHISDTHVQAVPASKVLNSQAYLLFYERIL